MHRSALRVRVFGRLVVWLFARVYRSHARTRHAVPAHLPPCLALLQKYEQGGRIVVDSTKRTIDLLCEFVPQIIFMGQSHHPRLQNWLWSTSSLASSACLKQKKRKREHRAGLGVLSRASAYSKAPPPPPPRFSVGAGGVFPVRRDCHPARTNASAGGMFGYMNYLIICKWNLCWTPVDQIVPGGASSPLPPLSE